MPSLDLKLPSFAKGSVQVPVVKKKVPKIAIAGLVIAIIIAIYFYQKKKSEEQKLPPGLEAPLQPDPNQTQVQYEIVPNGVQPDASTTLVGQFKDMMGNPVSVPNAMYYVWETDINTNAKELRSQGSLGTNISRFNKPISTQAFRQGQYTVTVTDAPLPANEQMLLSRGPIVTGGSGEVAKTPVGSTQEPSSVTFAIS